ncbi:synemin [Protopterus annectens]|uniref:synemin n=1 Tax=Protopterus annectens TaxID=7888 RepID=UPI001CFAC61F|nr:synemin [Protopterus annectens]
MFHSIPGAVMDEKLQLRELNKRLEEYLSRVRQLEEENLLLAEEISALRSEQQAGWQRSYGTEISDLRRELGELRTDTLLAERDRDRLRQELAEVRGVCNEIQAERKAIEAELVRQQKELQQADLACTALEDLLRRLRGEYDRLGDSQERELLELRQQVSSMPARTTLSKSVQYHPTLNFAVPEYDDYKHGLVDSWRETIEHYQRKIQELEEGVQDDEQRLADVNEENKHYAHRVQGLSQELDELDGIRHELEDELLQLREAIQQEVEGYLVTIDELEDEKQALSADLTLHLKKQQELMQVKMGLNLEVAAYRALLEEEECNPETDLWTEQSTRKPSPGVGTRTYQYSFSDSAARRETNRKVFPVTRTTVIDKDRYFKPIKSVISETIKTSNKSRLPEKKLTGSSVTITDHAPFIRSTQFHHDPVLFSAPVQEQKSMLFQKTTFRKGETEKEATKPSTAATKVSKIVVQGSSDIQKDRPEITLVEEKASRSKGSGRISGEDKEKLFKERAIEVQTPNDKQIEREAFVAEQQILSSISTKPLIFGQVSEGREIPITLLGLQKDTTTPEMLAGDRDSNLAESRFPLEGKSTKQSEIICTVEQDASKNEIPVEIKSEEYLTYQQIPFGISSQPVIMEPLSEDREVEISSKSDISYPETLSEGIKSEQESFRVLPIDISVNISEERRTDDKVSDDYQTTKQAVQSLAEENTMQQLSENVTERDARERPDDYSHGIEVTLPASESNVQSQKANDILGSAKETQLEYNVGDIIPITDILGKVIKSQDLEATLSSLPDAGITYHIDRQDVVDGESKKTEITFKTSLKEDIDVSDESALSKLLNKETKNVTLEEIKETPVGSIAQNLIGLTMSGKEPVGLKSANVQIIEEPLEFPSSHKDVGDFERTFKIEELEGHGTAEKSMSFCATTDDFGESTIPEGNVGIVAEASESDKISSEPIYIVSTPDDLHHDETATIPCHRVVEISTESYMQPSKFTTVSKSIDIPGHYETKLYKVENENTDDAGVDIEKYLAAEGETTIVEEIRVPFEVHKSVVELSKQDRGPQVQLEETLEYLKDKVSDSLRERMSSLAGSNQDDTDSCTIDVRKVEQTSDDGKVTIVAEVNVKQEIDANDASLMRSSDDSLNELIMQSINPEIQKILKSRGLESINICSDKGGTEIPDSTTSIFHEPLEDQISCHVVEQKGQAGNEDSSDNYEVHDLYTTESEGQVITEDQSNEETARVSLEHLKDTISDNLRQELSSHTTSSQDDTESCAVDVRKVEQTSDDGNITIVAEVVSKELEDDDADLMKSSDDNLNELIMQSINPEIQKMLKSKGLENVSIFTSEDGSEISGPTASTLHLPLEDQTVYHVVLQKGPDGTEHSLSKYEVHDVYPSKSKEQDMSEDQDISEISRTVRHVTLGPNESSFTFQMDVPSLTSESGTEDGTQHPKILYLHKQKGATNDSEAENIFGSGQPATEIEHSQAVYEFQGSQVPDEESANYDELIKCLQLQRMVDPRSVISDEKKIAVMYLDDDDENPNQQF